MIRGRRVKIKPLGVCGTLGDGVPMMGVISGEVILHVEYREGGVNKSGRFLKSELIEIKPPHLVHENKITQDKRE